MSHVDTAAWRKSYGLLISGVAGRASSVPAMELAMTIDALVVLAAAALTLMLPRRAAARRPAVTEERAAEFSAGVAQQAK